jgi:beta-glucosidase
MTTSPLSVSDATLDRAAARLTGGLNGWSTTAAPELGVEAVVMVDGPLGLVSRGLDERDTSSLLPSGTALAATWDLQVVTDVGLLMGAEAVERGVDVVLGPNVNIPRTPLSGRAFEMYSEDPWLSGVLATAWRAGLQQQGIGVCAKHLVGNDTETERRFMNAQIGPTALREVYLRPFEMLVEAGVEMILMAYNRVNGTHCAENAELIDIIKDEWEFDGVLVSDWFGVVDTIASATAGLDLEMPGPARFFGERLVDAVERGDVGAERLADMTRRLLLLAERTGRRSGVSHPAKGAVPVDRDAVLERAAAASFTLLENRGNVLPLDPASLSRLAVIGVNATSPCLQGGTFARVNPIGPVLSPLDALRDRLGSTVQVDYAQGVVAPAPFTLPELGGTTPDGTPGSLLETFAPDGDTAAFVEVRQSSSFVWFGPVPGVGTAPDARIRVTTVLTPTESGEWVFGVGGTGDATLRIDDELVISSAAPPAHDVMGAVARAEVTQQRVQLIAGTPVTVVVESQLGGAHVRAVTATALPPQPQHVLQEAVELAAAADTVILVVGDHQGSSRESADRDTMALMQDQVELIERVAEANARTVVVVNASRAVHMPWADRAAAVLLTWFPGEQLSAALTSVLLGEREPKGRLPITIPMRDEDIPGWGVGLGPDRTLDYDASEPTGYRHARRDGVAPRYPFGFGLGYTGFEVNEAQVSDAGPGAPVTVTVAVRNTGDRAGRDVIQAYVRAPGEIDCRLAGYGAIELAGGEAGTTTFTLDTQAFRRWDASAGNWTIPSGGHQVLIGRSSVDLPIAIEVQR